MKTTVDIQDSLLKQAQKVAARENTTVRSLIEDGLRQVIALRNQSKPFKLRDASVKGKGLHPDLEGASWDRIREMIYEDRGG